MRLCLIVDSPDTEKLLYPLVDTVKHNLNRAEITYTLSVSDGELFKAFEGGTVSIIAE
jgi:hypothetical protein